MVVSKWCLFYSFFHILFLGYAQQHDNPYVPSDAKEVMAFIDNNSNYFIKNIEGPYSSEIKKIYRERDELFVKNINDSTYFFNNELQDYVLEILREIGASNLEIDISKYKFFIKNSVTPNAACYGNNIFEINLGLFTWLASDDEIAFVMCHEIAHKILNHNINNLEKYYKTLDSKSTKEEIRKLKNKKYGKSRAARDFIDGMSIDLLNYSQTAEQQADSLGMQLYLNTNFAPSSAITALEKLRVFDDSFLQYEINIDQLFNFESYPFKSYWIKEESTLFNEDANTDDFQTKSDTISTHPEIQERIDKLNSEYNEFLYKKNTLENSQVDIKEIVHYQIINSLKDYKSYDLALYHLVEFHNKELITTKEYHLSMIFLLENIYIAKQNHKLGKYVSHKNNLDNKNQLSVIKTFIHNIALSELKKLGWAYCNTYSEALSASTQYQFFKSIN